MKFSERWLRTLVDPPIDTATLCDRLTMAGFEVEDVASVAPPFTGVVVATIAAVAPHPDADRLRVCTVDAGTGAPLQIVCGAPNAAAGMRVACAMEGATLPGGHTIRRTTSPAASCCRAKWFPDTTCAQRSRSTTRRSRSR